MFIILQIFLATRAVLKIGEYHSDIPQLGNIRSSDTFKSVARERKYLTEMKYPPCHSVYTHVFGRFGLCAVHFRDKAKKEDQKSLAAFNFAVR